MDEKINEEILDKNNKYEKWMRDPHNLLFALLIIFTIGIRLYYFSMTANQPIWWDEGDYLALAKEFAATHGLLYVTERWLGGMLTNFKTISARIE